MKSDLIDLEMCLHYQTEKAILVSDDGDRENAVWLPKSLIEFEKNGDGFVTVTMCEQLAIDKELV